MKLHSGCTLSFRGRCNFWRSSLSLFVAGAIFVKFGMVAGAQMLYFSERVREREEVAG